MLASRFQFFFHPFPVSYVGPAADYFDIVALVDCIHFFTNPMISFVFVEKSVFERVMVILPQRWYFSEVCAEIVWMYPAFPKLSIPYELVSFETCYRDYVLANVGTYKI